MAEHWVEEIFERCGALLEGHFVLRGRHTGKYLDKVMVYSDGEEISDICFEMACEVRTVFQDIEIVVGPAEGGIILAHEVAKNLTTFHQRKVRSIFTEKDREKQVLKRPGFKKLVAGKKVLVVDDVLTTGTTIKEVIEEILRAGGVVVAVAIICNRSGATLDWPLFALWEIKIEDWLPEECPLCRAGIPINKEIGRGKENRP